MIDTRGLRSDACSFSTSRGKVTFQCMWAACKALTTGILLILLGSGMAVVGFYSTHATMDREANSTNFLERFSRDYKLTSMTYIGPAVMGVGGFIIVATCVLLLEARDAATKVIPLWLWPTHDHKILAVEKNRAFWETFHAQPQKVSERSEKSTNPSSSTKGGIYRSQFSENVYAFHCSLTSKVSSYDNSSKRKLQIFHPLCPNCQNPGGFLDQSSVMDSSKIASVYHKSQRKYNTRVKHVKTHVSKSSSEPTLNKAKLDTEDNSISTKLESFQNNNSRCYGKTNSIAVKEFNLQNFHLSDVYRPVVKYHVHHKDNIKSSRTISNESVPTVTKDSPTSFHIYNTFSKTDSRTHHLQSTESKRYGKILKEVTEETRITRKKPKLTDDPRSPKISHWKKHVAHHKAVLTDVPCSTERLKWKKDVAHKKTILTDVPCSAERLYKNNKYHKKTILTDVPFSGKRLYWKSVAHEKTILTDVPCNSETLYWKNNMAHKKTILTNVPCSSERLYWKNTAQKKTILTDVPCSAERLYWKNMAYKKTILIDVPCSAENVDRKCSGKRNVKKTLSDGNLSSVDSEQEEEEPKSQSTSTEYLLPQQKTLYSSLLSRLTKRP